MGQERAVARINPPEEVGSYVISHMCRVGPVQERSAVRGARMGLPGSRT